MPERDLDPCTRAWPSTVPVAGSDEGMVAKGQGRCGHGQHWQHLHGSGQGKELRAFQGFLHFVHPTLREAKNRP